MTKSGRARTGWLLFITLLTIIAMIGVTVASRVEMARTESYLNRTLASLSKGTLPLPQAQYELARMDFALKRDTALEEAAYRRLWTYNAVIVAAGALLVLAIRHKDEVD